MKHAYPDIFSVATTRRDQLVAKNDHVVAQTDHADAFNEAVRTLCRAVWPGRTSSPQLAIAADITTRQAERIMGREQGFSLQVYRKLIQCEQGDKFLALLIGDANPTWWRELNDGRNIVIAKKEKKLADRRFQEALERGVEL
jgi:hypothetical protein